MPSRSKKSPSNGHSSRRYLKAYLKHHQKRYKCYWRNAKPNAKRPNQTRSYPQRWPPDFAKGLRRQQKPFKRRLNFEAADYEISGSSGICSQSNTIFVLLCTLRVGIILRKLRISRLQTREEKRRDSKFPKNDSSMLSMYVVRLRISRSHNLSENHLSF